MIWNKNKEMKNMDKLERMKTYRNDDVMSEIYESFGIRESKPVNVEYEDSRWIRRTDSRKPYTGEQTWLCGYVYPGDIKYTYGTYCGNGKWTCEYDDMEYPDFVVLYWMRIERIAGAEEEI